MKQLPPQMLVKTWIYIIDSNEAEMDSQKFKLRNEIKEAFGSMELARLYVEEIADDDIEVYFV
jgi:hypothetical protein